MAASTQGGIGPFIFWSNLYTVKMASNKPIPHTIKNEDIDKCKILYIATYRAPNKIPKPTWRKVCILETIRCAENIRINVRHMGREINL